MQIFIVLFATVCLPLYADGLGINLGGLNLVGGVLNLIPNLLKGIRVDLLIDLTTILNILSRPIDPTHTIMDCASHIPNVTLGRNGLIVSTSNDKRWYKDGTTYFVPIVMDPRFTEDEKNIIYTGMTRMQDSTCMRFYIYNEADLQGYDYVYMQRGSGEGCYSDYIGRAKVGRQVVNIQPMEPSGCMIVGIVQHELLHAIGFDHMQCTPGRNTYVTINYNNIKTNAIHNFDEDSAAQFTSFGAPYDYGSVMHYGATAFTNNGLNTIDVKQAGAKIGQRDGMSSWDIYKVQKMHGCPA